MENISYETNKHAMFYEFKEEESTQDIENIIDNTYNTWQKDRDKDELTADTLQGKFAEKLFRDYVHSQLIPYFSNSEYIEYDEFRNDSEKKHAPFDALLIIDSDNKEEAILKVNREVESSHNGQISSCLKKWLRENNIFTVEIKSSKIPKSLYNTADNAKTMNKISRADNKYIKYIAAIIFSKYDYFCYPYYARTEVTGNHRINNFQDYTKYVNDIHNLKDVVASEIDNSIDIYTRVFLDFNHPEENKFRGIIFGTVFGRDIILNRKIGKMPGEKSNNARYLFSPINQGIKYDNHLEFKRRLENLNG